MSEDDAFHNHVFPDLIPPNEIVTENPIFPPLPHPEKRGLLASDNLQGKPVKGVYFFAGNAGNKNSYTAHPLEIDDEGWNGDGYKLFF